ncbi:MAG: c-type cytochrome [Sulfuricella sp.]|nr:c-type cytochrome [Sulfuricella sp.]
MKGKTVVFAKLASCVLFGLTVAGGAWADAGKLADSCVSCHGKDGANTEADVPNIGGYSAEYFSGAMKAYKGKERPCVESKIRSGDKKGTKTDMCAIVKDMSEADIKALAQHFSEKKFVRTAQKFDAALAKKGKDVHDKSCEKCHSEGGTLASDDAGMLAGQKMAYLKEQTEFFLGGKRTMPKKMKPKLEGLDKAEVEAVLNYYASVK